MAQAERERTTAERPWFCPFDLASFTDEQVTDATCPLCGGRLDRLTRAAMSTDGEGRT